MRRTLILVGAAFAFVMVQTCALAGGILPDRVNKVTIHGRFTEQAPEFLLIFSAQPLRDGKGQLLTNFTDAELAKVQQSKDNVCIQLGASSRRAPDSSISLSARVTMLTDPGTTGRASSGRTGRRAHPMSGTTSASCRRPSPGCPRKV